MSENGDEQTVQGQTDRTENTGVRDSGIGMHEIQDRTMTPKNWYNHYVATARPGDAEISIDGYVAEEPLGTSSWNSSMFDRNKGQRSEINMSNPVGHDTKFQELLEMMREQRQEMKEQEQRRKREKEEERQDKEQKRTEKEQKRKRDLEELKESISRDIEDKFNKNYRLITELTERMDKNETENKEKAKEVENKLTIVNHRMDNESKVRESELRNFKKMITQELKTCIK